MIFVAISRKNHSRAPEWFLATLMTGFGVTLMHPDASLSTSAYSAFNSALGAIGTGALVAVVGAAWLAGLWYNGRKESVTSTVRAVCNAFGVVVYAMLTSGFIGSYFATGELSPGLWSSFILSLLALYSFQLNIEDKGAKSRDDATARS